MKRATLFDAALLAMAVIALTTGCSTANWPSTPNTSGIPSSTSRDRVISLPAKAYPNAMAFADDGALWVTEKSISCVARIDPQGQVTQYRIPGESNDPDDILRGPDGEMWFIGFEVIGKVNRAGKMTGWQTGRQPDPGLPVSFTTGPDGSVWYTNDAGTRSVSRINTGQPPTVVAQLSNHNYVLPSHGIATGPDNAVWLIENDPRHGPDAIVRVDTNGRVSSWELPPDTTPWNIVAGNDKALWFTERTGIGRITVTGQVSHYPTPGGRPQEITSAPDGNLWFTTATQLGMITVSGQTTMIPVPDAKALRAIVPAPDGGFWLTDTETDVVRHFTPPR